MNATFTFGVGNTTHAVHNEYSTRHIVELVTSNTTHKIPCIQGFWVLMLAPFMHGLVDREGRKEGIGAFFSWFHGPRIHKSIGRLTSQNVHEPEQVRPHDDMARWAYRIINK